ncbi:alpha/beta hydrolase [Acidisphaera sp. L21]|uniref:alpha/beta hydrolase n=1 Tax=Acidisphaera sp. L21 TaxID=1641851 RepID=UPI002110CFAF|nr:alpha/beta hydrolase [Acidisphaera sp. L21]
MLLSAPAPAPATIGPPPADLVGAETVEIPSASGSRLHGWWVPITNSQGTVVLMHGVRANRLEMVARAHVLHDHGYSVLLFDFQAHGESPGRRITFGKLEALDAVAAVGFARHRRPGDRVGVIGVSLGGAATLLGPQPLAVDALVLESVYPDIDRALSNRLRANLGRIAGAVFTPILTPAFKLLLPPILGATPSELRPIDHIAQAGVPILIASGTVDTYTPLSEAKALFDRAAEPRQFWAVEGAAHVDLEQYDPARYWSVVLPFLDRHVKEAHR